jgi:hypothetical protein
MRVKKLVAKKAHCITGAFRESGLMRTRSPLLGSPKRSGAHQPAVSPLKLHQVRSVHDASCQLCRGCAWSPPGHPDLGRDAALSLTSPGPPARSYTFVRSPGIRRDQELRHRQEQDEQAGFPEPHGCRWRARSPGTNGHRVLKDRATPQRRKILQEVLPGDWLEAEEAAGHPIPAQLRARASASRARQTHSAVPALRIRAPLHPMVKTPSPNVRCPLLIGCAATTNQWLPLGLLGAHRRNAKTEENKSVRSEPEGRGLATSRDAIGWRCNGRDGTRFRAAQLGRKSTCP